MKKHFRIFWVGGASGWGATKTQWHKEAKKKKDFVTSDKIRNQLAQLGIIVKDEKDGEMSWNIE